MENEKFLTNGTNGKEVKAPVLGNETNSQIINNEVKMDLEQNYTSATTTSDEVEANEVSLPLAASGMTRQLSAKVRQKRTAVYYGKLRQVGSLKRHNKTLREIIKTGKAIVTKKNNGEKRTVIKNLTRVEIQRYKAKMIQVGFKLSMANDALKAAGYGLKNATINMNTVTKVAKINYNEQKEEKKLTDIKRLLNSAAQNGSLQELVTIKNQVTDPKLQPLLKRGLVRVIKKYNRSYIPISNISNQNLNEIFEAMSKWDGKKGSLIS